MPHKTARKDERFEFRMSRADRRLFQRAAELQGRNLSEFVLEALRESANRVLRENEVMVLTGQDRKEFIAALMKPPELDPKLRKAFSRHREPTG